MCNNIDLKSDGGLNAVLQTIVDEIAELETEGIEIDTTNSPIKYYATLGQFTADNLGIK